MNKLLNRLRSVSMVAAVALGACGPITAPTAPDSDNAYYEEGDEGVELPTLVEEVHAEYTPEAKAAGITGSVMLSAFVDRDGRVGRVEVTQSLDSELGLDQQAVTALREWRFTAGTRFGEPVPVRVDVEMTFNLR